MQKLSIVIPVYNEAATISELLRQVKAVELPGPLSREIILVDDASTDSTPAILEKFKTDDCQVIQQTKNGGKGTALRRGLAAATGDFIIIQDADLEYSPTDYPALLALLLRGKVDVVYGSRFANLRKNHFVYNSFYFGNIFLTWLSNRFNGLALSDMETGYKVFSRAALDRILPHLRAKRFGIEPEITARVAQAKLKLVEVPIHYNGRHVSAGKKLKYRDGLAALWHIVNYNWFTK